MSVQYGFIDVSTLGWQAGVVVKELGFRPKKMLNQAGALSLCALREQGSWPELLQNISSREKV